MSLLFCSSLPVFQAAAAGETSAQQAPAEDAQGQDPPTFTETVVVTATARAERPDALPFVTAELESRTLHAERMVRSVPEALEEVPGVMVQKTSHGQGSPYVRGFTGFRTLFLIDGVRLNNSVLREGPNQYWNTVDPFGLEKIEVVAGPVSVLYGSDSVGGTVQVLTPEPPAGGDGQIQGGFHLRMASAERSAVGRLEARGTAGPRLGYVLGVTVKSFGDVEAGGGVGRQPRTGYDERDADLKLRYGPNAGTQLVAAFQHVDLDDAWRTHRTIFAVPWRGTTAGNEKRRVLDQRRRLGYLELRRSAKTGWFDGLTANLSLHRQVETRDRVRADDRRDLQGTDVDTLGAWLRLEKETRRSSWTFGLESYRDDVGSFRERFDSAGRSRGRSIQGPVADDARYRLSGAFVQNRAALGRLELISGLRYTLALADARRVEDPSTGGPTTVRGDWDQLTGSLRFIAPAGRAERLKLFGGVSQAFRAPNLSDLTRFDSARSNEIETPAPGLRPERFTAYELGIRWRGRRSGAELAIFHTEIEDLIIRTPTGRTIDGDFEVTKRNGGGGFSRGVELRLEAVVSCRVTAFGAMSWLDGEADTFPTAGSPRVREPLDRLMPATGHLGARWRGREGRVWAEALVSVAATADELSSRDRADTQRIPPGGTPGYAVWTVRGGWEISEQWTLSAAVENLSDEEYRIHGSGLNEPGRNFVASIQRRF